MSVAERNLNRMLAGLGAVIDRSGFSHGEIEESFGWRAGRTEKLLCRRESIDMGEVVAILHVIDVEPADFFGEVFRPEPSGTARHSSAKKALSVDVGFFQRRQALVLGLLVVLLDKGVLAIDELHSGVDAVIQELGTVGDATEVGKEADP